MQLRASGCAQGTIWVPGIPPGIKPGYILCKAKALRIILCISLASKIL